MALQGPFFGRRESENLNPNATPAKSAGGSSLGAASGGTQPFTSPLATGTGLGTQAAAAQRQFGDNAATLTVGRNIKLKGVEITDCDTLVVEGQVEATMKSRVVQIADEGSFKGSVEVDIAEVRGTFDGDLKAKDKLVIYATGKVSGKIHYGKIVIEEGGQISGEVASDSIPASSRRETSTTTTTSAKTVNA